MDQIKPNEDCEIVELKVSGDQKILADKVTLAKGSEYFQAMFYGALQEAKQTVVNMQNIDGESLKQLVDYCYTKSIKISSSNVELLLETANYLLMSEVVNRCSEFMKVNLNTSNCWHVLSFSYVHNCQLLRNDTVSFICENFYEAAQNEDFLTLTYQDLSHILNAKQLAVPNEDFLYGRLKSWIAFDISERESYADSILEYLNLPLLSSTCLFDAEKYFYKSIKKSQYLKEFFQQCVHVKNRFIDTNFIGIPRSYTNQNYLMFSSRFREGYVRAYNKKLGKWESLEFDGKLVKTRGSPVTIRNDGISNVMMIVGGGKNTFTSKDVTLIDLNGKTLRQIASLNTSRSQHGVVAVQKKDAVFVYAVGGHGPERTVERWDTTRRKWQYVSPMNLPRNSFGIAALNGKVYVAGGNFLVSGFSTTKNVEALDVETETWQRCAPMVRARKCFSLVAAGGHLYALGGMNTFLEFGVSSVDRYDPASDTWSRFGNLPDPQNFRSACAYNGKIVVCKSFGKENENQFIALDVRSNTWENLDIRSTDLGMGHECHLTILP